MSRKFLTLRISTNVAAMNASQGLQQNQRKLERSMAAMASGSRINKAADDAAGLALSKDFDMSIRSAGQANRNTNDAISLIQIAEGSFNEMNTIMVRMRELAIAAGSDTISDTERGMINAEVSQLYSEIDRISASTKWGTKRLLSGEKDAFEFQVGIQANPEDNRIQIRFDDINTNTNTIGVSGVNLSTKEQAQQSLAKIDNGQNEISLRRSNLGAIQNRLISSLDNLSNQSENMTAANSRIKDTDVAHETVAATQAQIMTQSAVATLAQANQNPKQALQLIG